MKRFTKVALLLFACSILLSVWVIMSRDVSADKSEGDWVMTDAGTLLTYSGAAGDVVVPDTIEGVAVINVGDVFQTYGNKSAITSVTLPASVTTIPENAFLGCDQLTSITMPGVTTIGDNAFKNCTSLTEITLPSSLTSISLGTAFQGSGLSVIYSNSPSYTADGGCLYSADGSILVFVPPARTADLTVKAGTTTIGGSMYSAFAGTTIEEITLPTSVTTINEKAFDNSTVTRIHIPSSVTTISESQTDWNVGTIYGGNEADVSRTYAMNHSIPWLLEGETPGTNYTVTYYMNDGTATVYMTVPNVASGSTIASPAAPTRTGYTFDGWYKEEACTNLWAFATDVVTANTSLYAKWADPATTSYTVTYNANGVTATGMPAAEVVAANTTATVPANPTATGYTFGGWYTDAACTTAYSFSTLVTSDITLYAKWTANSATTKYTVQFSLNGKSGTKPNNQTVAANGKVTRPSDPTASGYTFTGWYTTSACTTAWNFDANVVTNNMTLYAGWTANTGKSWTVVFNMNGHGGLIASQTIADGGLVNKPADPRADGYVFGGWFTDNGFTTEWNFSANKVTKDMTLYAKWTKGDSSSSTNGGSSNSNGSTGSGSGGNGGSNTSGRDVTPQTADNSIDPRFILVFVLFLSGVGMIVYSRFSQMKYMSDNRRD